LTTVPFSGTNSGTVIVGVGFTVTVCVDSRYNVHQLFANI
jgi:hypothetical protein